jgi:hypothetical protein
MSYIPYATAADYAQYGSGSIPAEELDSFLHKASRHIDSLTFNRIVGKGFNNLTGFQQDIIKNSCCRLADFLCDNADLLESALNSYSLNGVSMSFGGTSVAVIGGVPVSREIYSLLSQSGLCTSSLNRRYF